MLGAEKSQRQARSLRVWDRQRGRTCRQLREQGRSSVGNGVLRNQGQCHVAIWDRDADSTPASVCFLPTSHTHLSPAVGRWGGHTVCGVFLCICLASHEQEVSGALPAGRLQQVHPTRPHPVGPKLAEPRPREVSCDCRGRRLASQMEPPHRHLSCLDSFSVATPSSRPRGRTAALQKLPTLAARMGFQKGVNAESQR